MTEKLETLAAILGLTGLVVAIPLAYWAWVDKRPQGPDVGVAVFDVDEDINAPSLDVIDAALILTTEPGARDYLLDKRIDAMRRAS